MKKTSVYFVSAVGSTLLQLTSMFDAAAATPLTPAELTRAYQLSEEGFEADVEGAIFNPHWIDDSRVAFVKREGKTSSVAVYDLQSGLTTQPLDLQSLAGSLSTATGQTIKSSELPLENLQVESDGALLVSSSPNWFRCKAERCTSAGRAELFEGWSGAEIETKPQMGPVVSPDGRYEVDAEGYDLQLITRSGGQKRRITQDGSEFNAYGNGISLSWAGANIYLRQIGWKQSPSVLWSPDSRHFVTVQIDWRRVRRMTLVDDGAGDTLYSPPVVYTYPYAMAGDAELPVITLVIVDAESGQAKKLQTPKIVGTFDPIAINNVRWTSDGKSLDIIEDPLVDRSWSWWRVSAASGEARKIHTEKFSQVSIVTMPRVTPLPDSREAIVWSQRDDFGRLYRYDGDTGRLLNTLNSGDLFVTQIAHIEPSTQGAPWIYFLAGEERAGRNPYDSQLYRVRADGTEQQRLGKSEARQSVQFAPNGAHYISTESRADRPTSVAIYSSSGKLLRELGAGRWKPSTTLPAPERFRIERGGQRDIFGVLYRPEKFDASKKYPVLHYVYGGHYTIDQPTDITDWTTSFARGLTSLGFAVVFYDGQGTTARRYSFNTYPDGKGYEHCNLEDAETVLRGLQASRPWLDLDRVGIAGWSNGGYCALRGMLAYPHLYKAAVAVAGNHDQRIQHFAVQRYIDPRGEGQLAWDRQSNLLGLERLAGPVLFITGDIDESVPATNTLRVVKTLSKLNKPFEMLYLPGEGHSLGGSGEFLTRAHYRFLHEKLGGIKPR